LNSPALSGFQQRSPEKEGRGKIERRNQEPGRKLENCFARDPCGVARSAIFQFSVFFNAHKLSFFSNSKQLIMGEWLEVEGPSGRGSYFAQNSFYIFVFSWFSLDISKKHPPAWGFSHFPGK